MTLRLRLTAALVVLTTIGLTVFGVVTARLYQNAQYDDLDDQLRNDLRGVTMQLYEEEGDAPEPPDGGGGDRPPPPLNITSGYVAELRTADGEVVARKEPENATSLPDLPDDPDSSGITTVGSATGSGRWRVLTTPSPRGDGLTVMVAVPLDDLEDSVRGLVVIEVVAGVVLLALLASGSWLILRRGLRPLERMATSAQAISAGQLTERVVPADHRSEVGELGLALNTMLDDIEEAFAARDHTEAQLRQFLADASHELRTPLTSIQGFAELIRLGGNDVEVTTATRRIEQEAHRMHGLVQDLLLLARLDQARPLAPAATDLAVLAADACADAAARARDRAITLAAPEPVVVLGVADELRKAVANLVGNAVQHTPAGSPIEVSATVHDGAGEVVVRDHGEGLSEDALAHAFDRFWRADTARSGTGTGLGLAIVAAVAHEHGGTVTAGNAPDGGAQFVLRIPLGASRSDDGRHALVEPGPRHGSPEHPFPAR